MFNRCIFREFAHIKKYIKLKEILQDAQIFCSKKKKKVDLWVDPAKGNDFPKCELDYSYTSILIATKSL